MKKSTLTFQMGLQVASVLSDEEAERLQQEMVRPRKERSTGYLVKTVNGSWVGDLSDVVAANFEPHGQGAIALP